MFIIVILSLALCHPAQADSYSLGVVLWELVTGELPVRGGMRRVRVPRECPAPVAALIDARMAAVPEARPTAAQVGKALRTLGCQR